MHPDTKHIVLLFIERNKSNSFARFKLSNIDNSVSSYKMFPLENG